MKGSSVRVSDLCPLVIRANQSRDKSVFFYSKQNDFHVSEFLFENVVCKMVAICVGQNVLKLKFYHDMQISWPDSGSPPIRLADFLLGQCQNRA